MNTRTTLLAVLTAALALPALADTNAPGVTREQVKAEYLRALKAGELDFGREFITPVSRQSTSAAAAKIEDLSPTAAGNQAAAVTTSKTAN
ncbi:DUF4148 domain-containing protein [Aquabacterium sp. CECT 9606]|uniref:DUF4148 domain-containing protein n=1 Tax=Aquabacterium sp. CECT 9606 TaxID=2845822 RepID=UPI001E4F02B7|nr:DUF4148 domain-containing protein [Aquabacterium sp. CECT 9606]CAH0349042.1 hypothetical protein AQB9606_00871 [Aquabacterium sp. CECT 9606]